MLWKNSCGVYSWFVSCRLSAKSYVEKYCCEDIIGPFYNSNISVLNRPRYSFEIFILRFFVSRNAQQIYVRSYFYKSSLCLCFWNWTLLRFRNVGSDLVSLQCSSYREKILHLFKPLSEKKLFITTATIKTPWAAAWRKTKLRCNVRRNRSSRLFRFWKFPGVKNREPADS